MGPDQWFALRAAELPPEGPTGARPSAEELKRRVKALAVTVGRALAWFLGEQGVWCFGVPCFMLRARSQWAWFGGPPRA